MGHAIAVRTDYTAGEVRRFAQRAKDAAQARRLLAIAAVLEGASREEAAKIGGMDRQTLRDWVIRFNEQGADGLINIPSPGMPPKLNAIQGLRRIEWVILGVEDSTNLGIARGFCILAGLDLGSMMDGTNIETPSAAVGYVFVSGFSAGADSTRDFR